MLGGEGKLGWVAVGSELLHERTCEIRVGRDDEDRSAVGPRTDVSSIPAHFGAMTSGLAAASADQPRGGVTTGCGWTGPPSSTAPGSCPAGARCRAGAGATVQRGPVRAYRAGGGGWGRWRMSPGTSASQGRAT